MRVSQLAPSPRLAPWVKCFSVVETDVQATRTLVPDGRASLGVRWAGAASLLLPKHALRVADCSLSGPRAQARVMRTEANSGLVLAVFHDGGASAFLDAPLSEHFGATRSLDDLFPRADVARLHQQVGEAPTLTDKIEALESFLLARIGRRVDPLIRLATEKLRHHHGRMRIDALSASLGVSADALEDRFHRHLGESPKRFASTLRVAHAIARFTPGTSLGALALDAGFSDQAHFTRELKRVTGSPPAQFFSRADAC